MAKITKEEALRYHAEGKPGKIEVIPTKPHSTQTDLSLAYSPGGAVSGNREESAGRVRIYGER